MAVWSADRQSQLTLFYHYRWRTGCGALYPKEQQYIDAVTTKVVDTTGAGDTYAVGLIDALLENENIISAMQQAAQWAAITVATESSIPGEQLQKLIDKYRK